MHPRRCRGATSRHRPRHTPCSGGHRVRRLGFGRAQALHSDYMDLCGPWKGQNGGFPGHGGRPRAFANRPQNNTLIIIMARMRTIPFCGTFDGLRPRLHERSDRNSQPGCPTGFPVFLEYDVTRRIRGVPEFVLECVTLLGTYAAAQGLEPRAALARDGCRLCQARRSREYRVPFEGPPPQASAALPVLEAAPWTGAAVPGLCPRGASPSIPNGEDALHKTQPLVADPPRIRGWSSPTTPRVSPPGLSVHGCPKSRA